MLLALIVVAIWGSNFVVIKAVLADMPPLLFATIRFFFVLLPAIFFVPRPKTGWGNLAAYGLLIGAGQFGLLYIAVQNGISPGLASLVMQTQVFVTIGLSMLFAKDKIKPYQCVALLCAVVGIVLIGLHTDSETTVKGLALTLGAASCWGAGNVVNKKAGNMSMFAYVVWSSLFSLPALLALTFCFESWNTIASGITHAHVTTWLGVLWQAVGNSLFGYTIWGGLLMRHPAATVAPMALLVPVFGMGASAWLLSEPLPLWKLAAAGLVIGGLALNLLWGRAAAKFFPRTAAPN